MAIWPTTVATDADLYVAVNDLASTLQSSISSGDTTITLVSTTGFPTSGAVVIDNEVIFYTGVSGSNLTGCTRGQDGTTAASHTAATEVAAAIVAVHHNVLKNEIIAIESSLNLTASRALVSSASGRVAVSTVTAAELAYLSGVTSAIQTQLDGKLNDTGDTLTGALLFPDGTTSLPSISFSGDTDTGLHRAASGTTEIIGNTTVLADFSPAGVDILGTNTNDSAASGFVGEYIASVVNTSANAATSAQYGDITSITLSAGDWLITAQATAILNGATATNFGMAIGTGSGNSSAGIGQENGPDMYLPTANYNSCQVVAPYRVSISSSTTYYLKKYATYSAGTPKFAGSIKAWRVR